MALDSKLTQTVNIQANPRPLLEAMEGYGKVLANATQRLDTLMRKMEDAGKLNKAELRRMSQDIGKTYSEMNQLGRLATKIKQQKGESLLSVLGEQQRGKKLTAAAQLTTDLNQASSAADAFQIRLNQIFQRVNERNGASKSSLTTKLKTEEALAQVQKLSREIDKLDSKVQLGRVGGTENARAGVAAAQLALMGKAANPQVRTGWNRELASLDQAVAGYRDLIKVQAQSALEAGRLEKATLRALNAQARLDPERLRSQVERNASQYSFTPQQARGTDVDKLIDKNQRDFARLVQYNQVLARASDPNSNKKIEQVQRLMAAHQRLGEQISKNIALEKAINSLPENFGKRINSWLFGDGGVALGTRVLGIQAIFGLINAVQSGARYVVEFEDSLAKLQAVAGATDTEMRAMSATIQDVAANTRYSSIEITKAATVIAQAGYSARETGQVLRDALTLATASGSDPTAAVDTLTSALGAFQLQAGESTRVTDILVESLNRSKLSIDQMQAAIQYAGATAKENGVRFEELAAIAASLANAGIRSGSTIGTGLRQLLVDLKTPTEDFKRELEDLGLTMADVDVRTNGLAEVVRRLTEAGFTAEAAYSSFEVRAASAFLAFRNQIDVYDELAIGLTKAGVAQAAAEKAMNSFTARGQQLLNVVGELAVKLSGPFVDALTFAMKAATGVVSLINGMIDGLDQLIVSVSTTTQEAQFFSTALTTALVAGTALFVSGGNPIVAGVAGLLALGGALSNSSKELDRLKSATNEASERMDAQVQTITSVDESIKTLIDRQGVLSSNQLALQTETLTLSQRFTGLTGEVLKASSSYDNLLQAMVRVRGEAARQAYFESQTKGMAAQAERREYMRQLESDTTSSYVNTPWKSEYLRRNGLGPLIPQLQKTLGFNVAGASGDALMRNGMELNDLIRRIEAIDPKKFSDLVDLLRKRFANIAGLDSTNATIRNTETLGGVYRSQGTPTGRRMYGDMLKLQQSVSTALRLDKENPGSQTGRFSSLRGTLSRTIEVLTQQAQNLATDNPDGVVLRDYISQLQELNAQLTRTDRLNQPDKGVRPLPTGAKMKSLLEAQFPGIVISSYKQRGPGDAGYQPGTYHAKGGGNAIDVTRLPPGVSPNDIKRFIESQESVQLAPGGNGYRNEFTNPSRTATGGHHHFGWQAKSSRYDSGIERQTDSLVKQAVGIAMDKASKAIELVLEQAKSGSSPILDMKKHLEEAVSAWQAASIKKFETENPVDDLSSEGLKARSEAMADLKTSLNIQAATYIERFFKQIKDYNGKVFETAMAQIEAQLENELTTNAIPVALAEQQAEALTNSSNRYRFGAGAQYGSQRQVESAKVDQLGANARSTRMAAFGASIELTALQESNAKLPAGSEADADQQKKLVDAQQKVMDLTKAATEAQNAYNAATQRTADIPLPERLMDAAAAWFDSSGAMDDWGKRLENSIAPLLENLTSGLTDFFSSIIDGSKSVGSALKDLVGSFTKFVTQMILQALALEAVKWIFSMFGFNVQGGTGGTSVTKSSYNGGLVTTEGRYNGGPVGQLMGGGRVNRGVSTRDSALYNLAEGEYVVRNKSVRELGIPFMDAINDNGAKALNKMSGSNLTNIQAPRQETNVWVVKESERPQMGPNDVLVTIHEDILQGGATKRLIKQVAAGA